MALINYTRPNTDLFSRRFNDIVDELFNNTDSYRRDSFMPSVDVAETDTHFEISAELPGMNKEDIKVDLENGRLSITGERSLKKEEEDKNFHRLESHYGTFSRSFYLPDSIDEDSIQAKYENGILNITIAKDEQKVRKHIEIA